MRCIEQCLFFSSVFCWVGWWRCCGRLQFAGSCVMLTATKAAENHLNETLPSPTSEPAAASRAVVWSASAQGLLQVVLCSGHRHDNKSVPTRTGGGAHNGSYHKTDTWKYRIHQVQAGCWRALRVDGAWCRTVLCL